jgi:hypothetical protein
VNEKNQKVKYFADLVELKTNEAYKKKFISEKPKEILFEKDELDKIN